MVKVVWTNYSFLDLKGIHDYISRDSKKYAINQIRRIKTQQTFLRKILDQGELCPN